MHLGPRADGAADAQVDGGDGAVRGGDDGDGREEGVGGGEAGEVLRAARGGPAVVQAVRVAQPGGAVRVVSGLGERVPVGCK